MNMLNQNQNQNKIVLATFNNRKSNCNHVHKDPRDLYNDTLYDKYKYMFDMVIRFESYDTIRKDLARDVKMLIPSILEAFKTSDNNDMQILINLIIELLSTNFDNHEQISRVMYKHIMHINVYNRHLLCNTLNKVVNNLVMASNQ